MAIADMEDDLQAIKDLSVVLRLLAGNSEYEDSEAMALSRLASEIQRHAEAAGEKRCEAFHRTWAYAYGSRREQIAAMDTSKGSA